MISIKQIKKKYNEKTVLKDISLSLPTHGLTSLLGVNGAGKTTLSLILAGIVPPSNGDILYHDKSIYNSLSSYKKNISLCQQQPNLDSTITLRENLYYAGTFFNLSEEEIKERIHFLSRTLSLEDYLDTYDYTLSGGYRQRFMIARSLIHQPKLLILDEPTVAMDADIRKQLWTILRELKTKISILLTTHYLEEAEELSDNVCILDKGHIKEHDTVAELLKKYNKKNLESVFLSLLEN
jgi:ABC-2 type transport system ATP-binding protein